MNSTSQPLTGSQLIRSTLLFFGAFLFAFSLNSYIIHEAGHAFGGGCSAANLRVSMLILSALVVGVTNAPNQ